MGVKKSRRSLFESARYGDCAVYICIFIPVKSEHLQIADKFRVPEVFGGFTVLENESVCLTAILFLCDVVLMTFNADSINDL